MTGTRTRGTRGSRDTWGRAVVSALVAFVAVLTVTAPVGGALAVGAPAHAPPAAGTGSTVAAGAATQTSTLVVDDDRNDCSAAGYTSITRAINQSDPGDVVRVCPGTYVEDVTIDHALSLVGEPGAVLDGNGSLETGVRIAASDVTVEGLTIRGYTHAGIDTDDDVRTVSAVTIRDNRIEEIDPAGDVNAHRGIQLEGSESTVRTDWTIAGNTLVDTDSYGIAVVSTGFVEGVDVRNNAIRAVDQSAGLEAVLVAGFGSEPVRDVTVRGNDVDTDNGIRVANNRGSTVEGTVIENNSLSVGFRAVYLNPYCGVSNTNCTATQRDTLIRDNDVDARTGVEVEVEDTARLRDLRIVDGNAIDASGDGVRLASGTPAAAVSIHGNEFAAGATFGVNNRNATAVVNATRNDWGRPTGPASPSDPDAPFADPVTGQAADGSGAAVSEGATAGVANVHFDPTVSARTITDCTVVDSPGRYVLGNDIRNSSARVCINVTTGGVVVDGAGHTVEGRSAFPSFGVLVDGGGRLGNVTVRNLRVTDWATGVGYRNASGRITRVRAVRNYDGIAFLRGESVSVVRSRLVDNAYGVDVLSSTGIRVRNTTARGGDYGIRLRSTDSSRLVGNHLRRNVVAGAALSRSVDNLLRNNTARDNAAGIELVASSDANVLVDNRAVGNAREGIGIADGSDGNRLEGNRLVDNRKGVSLSGATGTRLLETVARNNSRDFHAEAGALDTDVENLTLASATVSFEGRDVAVDTVDSPPVAPTGTPAIGQYVSVEPTNQNLSGFDPADSWAFLNVSYTDTDASGVNESALRLWRYDRATGNWSLAGPPNGVDSAANYVFANVTDFSVFAPLAGTGADTEPDTGGLQVSLRPRNGTATAGGQVTFDLVASNVTDGVSAYDLNVTVGNASVANVTGGSDAIGGRLSDVTVATGGDRVRFQVAGASSGNGTITLATVTLGARAPGTTGLSLSNVLVGDRNDSRYAIATLENATVTVDPAPAAPDLSGNGEPARDLDGDGLHEDITGDGTPNVIDVSVFLGAFDSPAVQNNPALFDFNRDGDVNILDVATLLGTL